MPIAAGFGLLLTACGGAVAQTSAKPAASPTPSLNEAADPKLGQILTEDRGRVLYHFLPEKGGKIVCTGECARTWLPLLATGAATPTHDLMLSGTVSTVARPDGSTQVAYYEWPLYTFSGDRAPADTHGQGVARMWFVQVALAPPDADNDNDGTTPPPAATVQPPAQPAQPPAAQSPAAQPPAAPPPTQAPAPMRPPAFNDGDADNRGGPSDGDGNG
ncbi:MAG: hypothetical protein JF888_07835 [Candidatus Dormibacteraeota bacterium]|uniref:Lipoprotein n=1 Tax=Candidatus Dormiibacter inghamiae TaxID=3127013 RepID=A0A934NC44_9BACT|nr:hypothetical protein [Candidatus Dormibacteraeota bacterium]MBJ7606929.1 hypothetical protein [Candidatus Dormibacteraeota bacterium]